MSKLRTLILLAVSGATTPAFAETYLCTPIGLAEMIGEPGPLTIPAAEPDLGDPIVFWIDTQTGDFKEHFEGGESFITGEGQYENVPDPDPNMFVGYLAEQEWQLRIDVGVSVSPYYIVRDSALAELGTCVAAPMGELID